MSAVKALNPKAEVARAHAALAVNISAARGLQDVLKSNLGPKGTMKMWVICRAAQRFVSTCLSPSHPLTGSVQHVLRDLRTFSPVTATCQNAVCCYARKICLFNESVCFCKFGATGCQEVSISATHRDCKFAFIISKSGLDLDYLCCVI